MKNRRKPRSLGALATQRENAILRYIKKQRAVSEESLLAGLPKDRDYYGYLGFTESNVKVALEDLGQYGFLRHYNGKLKLTDSALAFLRGE